MATTASSDARTEREPPLPVDIGAVLNAVADALLVVRRDLSVLYANIAAEQFFDASAVHLCARPLDELLPKDSPVFALIEQVFERSYVVSEYGVTLDTPRIGQHIVNVQVAPVAEADDLAVLTVHEQSIARKLDNQLTSRNAARSVTGMAALLAHEVKNPLSGIRGAAQLLEAGASGEDRALTQLILDEADRIVGLVDRMDMFADSQPMEREPVNIHLVLEHVRRLAQNGFGSNVRFREHYDPSLPPVHGNRDRLVQVFLNLVKNACEAVRQEEEGEVTLSTAYRHGVRLALPGTDSRVHLPLEVTVEDNGPGIPEDLRTHLFDPFVTTKPKGTGLGLALVAKIVGDHGGIVESDSKAKGTRFRVMLPTGPSQTSEE